MSTMTGGFYERAAGLPIGSLTAALKQLRTREALLSSLAIILPFLAYLRTLAPTIYNLDSAELTVAAATGGLMRSTGYPLYLLLARAWSLIPIGDVGFRLNLFSAFCGAAGVWLAYRIMRRLSVKPVAALGAAGLLAFAPFYWSLSLVAEVYTLHVLLMGVIILQLMRWSKRPTPKRFAIVAFWLGLAGGHHLATVLLLPGIVYFLLATGGRRTLHPRMLGAALLGGLIGLSVYLYLPYRFLTDPAFNYAGSFDAALRFQPVNLASLEGLWWLVSGKSFAGQMLAYSGADLLRELAWFAGHLGRAFLFVGIGPGLLGLAVLFRRDRRLAITLGLMFGLTAFFYIDYAVVDKETMFLPTYLVWAILIGVGYQSLADRIRGDEPAWVRRSFNAVVLGFVLAAGLITGPQVDLSADVSTRTLAEEIAAGVRQDAVVFGWWDTVPPLQYLQLVEGRRPDITAVNRFLIDPADLHAFVLVEMENRPVYVDSFPADWADDFRAVPVGGLFRLEIRYMEDDGGYRSLAR